MVTAMLISDKWIALKQIHETLFEYFHGGSFAGDLFGANGEARRQTWIFCEKNTSVRLALADGSTKPIPPQIVANPIHGLIGSMNDHVDITDGRLGSGRKQDEIYERTDGSQGHAEYGPHLGLAIVFAKKDFEKFMLGLKGDGNFKSKTSVAELKLAILAAHAEGKIVNKAWAKKNIAANASHSQFNSAWAAAAEEAPLLSTPGRKSAPTAATNQEP